MVKITNGVNVFEVTEGAFNCIYSKQGYTLFNDKDFTKEEVKEENTEEDAFVVELLEKPISQWSKEEIKKFAAIKNIDITGTKNAQQAKEIIKVYLEDIV